MGILFSKVARGPRGGIKTIMGTPPSNS